MTTTLTKQELEGLRARRAEILEMVSGKGHVLGSAHWAADWGRVDDEIIRERMAIQDAATEELKQIQQKLDANAAIEIKLERRKWWKGTVMCAGGMGLIAAAFIGVGRGVDHLSGRPQVCSQDFCYDGTYQRMGELLALLTLGTSAWVCIKEWPTKSKGAGR